MVYTGCFVNEEVIETCLASTGFIPAGCTGLLTLFAYPSNRSLILSTTLRLAGAIHI
jgi:hypothetical protein